MVQLRETPQPGAPRVISAGTITPGMFGYSLLRQKDRDFFKR